MFGKFRREEISIYDEPIAKTLEALKTYDTTDAEFEDAMKYLERLTTLKEAKKGSIRNINLDTLIIAGANIAVALIVVGYEQKHVVTSKVKDLLLRLK